MPFANLDKPEGLAHLNDFLADKSYIEGYAPSAADAVVFGALKSAPAATYEHALRWFNHITSYGAQKDSFPGEKKDLAAYGSAAATAAAAGKKDAAPAADEDDIDLFGSDEEEDEEAKKVKEARVAEYAAKKGNKPVIIAKSSLLIDVKPWDDETDMAEMEKKVRTIEADGLIWGQAKLIPIGYGIKKLQINAVIEDDKISTDFLEEQITGFEEYVQSMDIAAFNKI